jgi:HAD superfamily hydrolase (TIGR01549 family)
VVKAVVFDVGETLVDETRAWSDWADWLGIPRLTLMAVLGGIIARGQPHREAFHLLRPGIDLRAEVEARRAAARDWDVLQGDLYPDALPCLRAVRDAGYRVGIAGNQPSTTEAVLRELDVDLELVVSSATWRIEKPDPAFFERIAEAFGLPPAEIAYVGDRVDNDIVPALAVGMRAVFLRRGPWGYLYPPGEGVTPSATIDSLDGLVEVLRGL